MEWGLPGLSLERGKGRKKIEEGPDPPPLRQPFRGNGRALD